MGWKREAKYLELILGEGQDYSAKFKYPLNTAVISGGPTSLDCGLGKGTLLTISFFQPKGNKASRGGGVSNGKASLGL